MRRLRSAAVLLRLFPAALVVGAAACSDRTSISGGALPDPDPRALATLDCRVAVRAATVTCTPAAPAAGARADLLVGGQGQLVKLTSSNVSYDGEVILSADVTLQNLLPQAMGTTDGSTPAPQGIRVFFHTGPVRTAGEEGEATVENPDGYGVFTAANQPYFRYDGILLPGETSAPKRWEFRVSPFVETFAFTLLVSAPLPREAGYVTVAPQHPSVPAGGTRQLSAGVRSGAGTPQPGAAVTWSSSNPAVASVDANGLVTAHAVGTVTITATSGGRTGTTLFTVGAGQGDDIPPTLTALAFPVDSTDVTAAADSVVVTISADDDLSAITRTFVRMRSPSGAMIVGTAACARTAGTETNGTWTCGIQIPQGAEDGVYRLEAVALEDAVGHERQYDAAEIQAGGWPITVHVTGALPDTAGPELVDFSIDPDSVDVSTADDMVNVTISARDAAGLSRTFARLRSGTGQLILSTVACDLTTGTQDDGTWVCPVRVPRSAEAGFWTVEVVALQDGLDNEIFYSESDLSDAGFETVLRVTSSPSDNEAPALTGFSFAPDTVHVASSADTVAVTIAASDDVSGVVRVFASLRSASQATLLGTGACERTAGTANAGTWACDLHVPQNTENGTYDVYTVVVEDAVGRMRVYETAELQSAGFPTRVVVQP